MSRRAAKILLKKHVGLIHCSAGLSLLERRLFNWLLFQAYDTLLTTRTHRLPLTVLKGLLGWESSNNNEWLEEALTKLASTSAQYNLLNDDLGSQEWQTASLLSWAKIASGVVEWRYDEAMATWLHHPRIYALLNLRIQQSLSSAYSCALYEQVVRFKDIGTTGEIPLHILTKLLNATAESLKDFRYFNRDVLKPAVAEINAVTDLEITPRLIRGGRTVQSVAFVIRRKAQADLFHAEGSDNGVMTADQKQLADQMRKLGCSKGLVSAAFKAHPIDHLRACVSYVEERLEDGKVKTSAAGYFAVLVRGETPTPAMSLSSSSPEVVERRRASYAASAAQLQDKRNEEATAFEQNLNQITQRIALMSDEDLRTARSQFEATLTAPSNPVWSSTLRRYNGSLGGRFQIWLRAYIVRTQQVH